MSQIWKFPCRPTELPQSVMAPASACPVALGRTALDNTLVFWATIPNVQHPRELLVYWVVGTGWDYDTAIWEHVDTFVDGEFVWHLLRPRT